MNNEKKLLLANSFAGFSQWADVFLLFTVPIFVWNSSVSDIAIISFLFGVPSLLIGPFVGGYIDRNNPYKIMVLGAILRMALSFLMVLTTNIVFFMILVFFKGLSNILYWPPGGVVTNTVLESERRVSYYSSLSAIDQTTKVITPLLIAYMGLIFPGQYAFVFPFILSLFGLFFLLRIQYSYQPIVADGGSVPIYKNVWDGVLYLGNISQNLKFHIAVLFIVGIALSLYDHHLPYMVKSLGFNTKVFSLIVTATAIGAISGAFITKIFLKKMPPFMLSKIGFIAFLISIVIINSLFFLNMSMGPILFALVWFINGIGYEIFMIGYSVNMQNSCAKEYLGRVMTSTSSMQRLLSISMPTLGAIIISYFSFKVLFSVVFGVLVIALACYAIAFIKGHASKRYNY